MLQFLRQAGFFLIFHPISILNVNNGAKLLNKRQCGKKWCFFNWIKIDKVIRINLLALSTQIQSIIIFQTKEKIMKNTHFSP